MRQYNLEIIRRSTEEGCAGRGGPFGGEDEPGSASAGEGRRSPLPSPAPPLRPREAGGGGGGGVAEAKGTASPLENLARSKPLPDVAAADDEPRSPGEKPEAPDGVETDGVDYCKVPVLVDPDQ